VIPNEGQLQAISHMREGNLAEIPFAVVLHALAVHRRSVVLEVERPPIVKAIIFENGVPVECQSNMLHETLSRFMVARGDLSPEKEQELFNKSISQGLQFGEVLILDGILSAPALFKTLQQNLAKKLLDGFSWRSGEFRILDEELPEVASPLKVKAPQLVVTGIGKFALAEEVNEGVTPLVGKKLFLHPDPPFPLDDIRIGKAQQQLISLLDGGKRIDELAAETTVPFEQIMRLLYSLAVIGIVVPEDRLPKEVPKKAPKQAEPTVQDTQTVTVPVRLVKDPEKEHNRLMEAYLRYRKQDAFDLLGVSEDATIEQIERCYLRFSRRFAPWQFNVPGLKSLVEKAEDLFFAGGRAFGELCDREQRNTLILRRRNLRLEAKKGPARERFAIKSQLLDPEAQFKKGKALMDAGKFRDAEQQLQFAFDCDPQNSTYRAELAYCSFQRDPDFKGEKALEGLKETLRIDPKCGLAVYYAGLVSGELEYYDQAEKYLRSAIKVMMPDRRPIEGLKALQESRKKKKKGLFG